MNKHGPGSECRDFFILASSYLCAMKISELYEIYKKYPSVQTDTRKIKKTIFSSP